MLAHSALHSFHIPVMGLAYTIDSPIRIAHYGISSVVSLGDDMLIERVRKFYAEKLNLLYSPILLLEEDARARRITAYLNMMQEIVSKKFEEHKTQLLQSGTYFENFMKMLPDYSRVKQALQSLKSNESITQLKTWLDEHLHPGAIDVNIMTKLDKANQLKGATLSTEYNDAHAALRGFANSQLSSSMVFSAGMNPRLFSYMESFDDFYPQTQGGFKKKITIKVSDYRSALIQGKFLAKKGLWVSEYRIESGLNCGGHAFATQGYLMGPILEEFKQSRNELIDSVFVLYQAALMEKGRHCPEIAPELKITAQGGVGTAHEHEFLLDYYQLHSVGWGSPFLLVPEAVSIDNETLNQLSEAKEDDLYLSHASPLGVPFNNLRNSSRQRQLLKNVKRGKPGNPCTKKYLVLNTEFTEAPICTASSKYQKAKIEALAEEHLSPSDYQRDLNKIVEKECLCGGLATAFMEENGLDTKLEGKGVSVCPGPNMAYFSGRFSLLEMIEHIYGKRNIITRSDRPHVFIKELQLYVSYHQEQIKDFLRKPSPKEKEQLKTFQTNLLGSIDYYKQLFLNEIKDEKSLVENMIHQLLGLENSVKELQMQLD